jgi:hypothetical protein
MRTAFVIALAFTLSACSSHAERFDKQPRSWTSNYEPRSYEPQPQALPPATPQPKAKPRKVKKKKPRPVVYRAPLMECRSKACVELCAQKDVRARPRWCSSFRRAP